jgi:hypothetical protein
LGISIHFKFAVELVEACCSKAIVGCCWPFLDLSGSCFTSQSIYLTDLSFVCWECCDSVPQLWYTLDEKCLHWGYSQNLGSEILLLHACTLCCRLVNTIHVSVEVLWTCTWLVLLKLLLNLVLALFLFSQLSPLWFFCRLMEIISVVKFLTLNDNIFVSEKSVYVGDLSMPVTLVSIADNVSYFCHPWWE